MRHPEVILAVVPVVETHPVIAGIVGADGVFKDGDRDLVVPSLQYKIIGLVQTENWEPCRIQWTAFAYTDDDLFAIELALAELFGLDGVGVFSGLEMMAHYGNFRSDVEGLADGIRGSSTDYVLTPVRSRYVRAFA